MKKSLRFASAALALTLAAGCAMPAFAAGKNSFSKSETVYAVMNGDGSIKSTTVSEHLYSASGLANVTDKTTLTDIQNTESDAEFTQNGEELVWNTNDTDVYYKGNTDKALHEAENGSLQNIHREALLSDDRNYRPRISIAYLPPFVSLLQEILQGRQANYTRIHCTPSLLSLTAMPISFKMSRMRSDSAQFLSFRA